MQILKQYYPLDNDCTIDNELGNNGEIFTNDAGQSIPNPEGYATKSEIALTREIFGDLAHIFPERFITKDNTNVPESFKLFKDKKKPIYQVIIVPYFKRFRVGSFP